MTVRESPLDWNFKTLPAEHFKGYHDSQCTWPQGRHLGGSSGINAMLYTEGVPKDYDNWSLKHQLKNWDYSSVEPYFRKLNAEECKEGFVYSTRYESKSPSRLLLFQAAIESGIHVNDNQHIFGYRDVPVSVYKKERFCMSKAYLRPAIGRPNLCVLKHTLVGKIIIRNDAAIGVEINIPGGKDGTMNIYTRKEVILSAGAVNSPKLLMLSGIGPKNELEKHGIPSIKDSPAVGTNLQDHIIVPIVVELTDLPLMIDYSTMLYNYAKNQDSLDKVDIANFQGYFNTENAISDQPNIEFIHFTFYKNDRLVYPAFINRVGFNHYYTSRFNEMNRRTAGLVVLPTLLHPLSRGSIRLESCDTHGPPIIDTNYLSEPKDLEVLLDGIEFFQKIKNAPALRRYPFTDLKLKHCDNYLFASRDYWRCYVLTFVTTVYHPIGTCAMGVDPKTSVVDEKLKVWGVKNLRVIDASVMPETVSGHPNIPVCMVAEKAADIIKEEHGHHVERICKEKFI